MGHKEEQEGRPRPLAHYHLALSRIPEPREGTLSVRRASGLVGWCQGPQAVSSALPHGGQWPLPSHPPQVPGSAAG